MAFRVTRGSTSRLLPIAFGVSWYSSDGLTAPQVADDRTDARTYKIHGHSMLDMNYHGQGMSHEKSEGFEA